MKAINCIIRCWNRCFQMRWVLSTFCVRDQSIPEVTFLLLLNRFSLNIVLYFIMIAGMIKFFWQNVFRITTSNYKKKPNCMELLFSKITIFSASNRKAIFRHWRMNVCINNIYLHLSDWSFLYVEIIYIQLHTKYSVFNVLLGFSHNRTFYFPDCIIAKV